jgi:hypothetical protein
MLWSMLYCQRFDQIGSSFCTQCAVYVQWSLQTNSKINILLGTGIDQGMKGKQNFPAIHKLCRTGLVNRAEFSNPAWFFQNHSASFVKSHDVFGKLQFLC